MDLPIYLLYHLRYSPGSRDGPYYRSLPLKLQKFIARRGVPSKVVSENGKTFVAAAKILTNTVVNEVKTHLAPLHLKWTFNIECAPWWGECLKEW